MPHIPQTKTTSACTEKHSMSRPKVSKSHRINYFKLSAINQVGTVLKIIEILIICSLFRLVAAAKRHSRLLLIPRICISKRINLKRLWFWKTFSKDFWRRLAIQNLVCWMEWLLVLWLCLVRIHLIKLCCKFNKIQLGLLVKLIKKAVRNNKKYQQYFHQLWCVLSLWHFLKISIRETKIAVFLVRKMFNSKQFNNSCLLLIR